jgi:hypothetical protein
MTRSSMADALAPLRARMPAVLREREVLRVAATTQLPDAAAAMDRARHEVLAWAQRRAGGPLPQSAWNGETFEFMPGGRTTLGARIREEGRDLWALRGDDPDKDIPGRTWTTEVAVGRSEAEPPRLSLRLVLSTAEQEPDIVPAVPGLLRQLIDRCGLRVGPYPIFAQAWQIASPQDIDRLIAMLGAADRRLPVFVASGDERGTDPDQPLLDADNLAHATLGLAHVVPAAATYRLSDAFGKVRSVYHGAVRVYMPGFDPASDPRDHRLILADTVRRDPAACLRVLRHFAAAESLRRTRLGHDVVPFAAVRSVALRIEQQARADAGASEADLLAAAQKRIDALEAELAESRAQADQNVELAHQEEERARSAEAQLFGARARIGQLEEQLTARGQKPDTNVRVPETWDGFADWCDQTLIGRLVLAPAARNGIKKAAFADVPLAARCMLWLAGTCRDRRMNGGGSLANIAIEPGIENSPCGADAFKFDFHGQRLEADWHVKTGGNTRDPARCLRIYYAWDETTEQMVVADMPSHRRTAATLGGARIEQADPAERDQDAHLERIMRSPAAEVLTPAPRLGPLRHLRHRAQRSESSA